MSIPKVLPTAAGPALAVLILGLALPGAARAQFSSIGAVGTGNILENAPIFTESALVHEQGGVSLGVNGLYVGFDEEEIGLSDDFDVSATQLLFGLAFGVTDRITVGATVPWARATVEFDGEEEDASGLLDTEVFARAQLWRSADDRTKLAGLGSVTLKTASGDFEEEDLEEDPDFAVGAAVSHALDQASLHGSLSYTFAGGAEFQGVEVEGNDVLGLTAAAVFSATEKLKASGEVAIGLPDEGDTSASLAGGLRYTASPNLFIDGGILLPVSGNLVSFGALLGLTWVR